MIFRINQAASPVIEKQNKDEVAISSSQYQWKAEVPTRDAFDAPVRDHGQFQLRHL